MTPAEMQARTADLYARMRTPAKPLAHPIDRGGCTNPRCTSCPKESQR
ncbi:hypothetical protein [Nonomuraea wenchangensis]|uniref:Uncharacterized protein n=1 Tax=Nonomuraea wenchangensis TaxID=568860 RepID=A0A1I0ENZ7_9ACTN|nr:hypothetical protein [Nonomuraea wenchangensis]SET47075.1 hypothetical protein SAMN05421811_103141 [Nonomuraea wenchangensis]